ncbi:MAG: hypothetical protein KatS3mg126_1283 [Lysobacteraceae bacterium]|nr:MAG: hypothetical protein KatS3mg126_1283 [Xanthomonadaceae bacterium]
MNALHRRTLTGTTLVVLGLLFVAGVVLSGALLRGLRLDLTENRLYTLSEGTRAILERLEEPVHLTFYFSEHATGDIPQLRTYANRVRELLEEMAQVAGGKLQLEVIDPQPFSEEEDRATAFGLQAVPLGDGASSLFFGLAGTNSTDGQMAIPFFQPDKEAFLEYDIAKLISGLSGESKPVVGLISTLDLGPGFDPAARRVTDGQVIYEEMRNLFEVKRLEPTVTRIDDGIQLLMLVHPRGLSADTLYAIDQFVLRGGRLLVFVDPHSEMQQSGADADPAAAMFEGKSSDLKELFAAWGVKYDPDRVVLDGQTALQIQVRPDRPPVRHLAILGLGPEQLNQDDVVSADLGVVNFSTAGYFLPAEGATTRLEALAQSSGAAMTVPSERVRFLPDPEQLFADFTPTGERYVLAARLSGKLKTAFPDRKDEGHLAESKGEAGIILVADTDLLSDRLWVQIQQFFGQRLVNAFADNGNFVVNAVDNLTGSSDLIKVRTRPTSRRPFTTVEALKRQADDRFRAKEQELQAQLSETERRLTELQKARNDQGSTLLTPEQRAELQRFQQEKLRIRKELRQVRRQLDADIDALGAKLKFINIVGVPLLVTLAAVGFALWRARRRKEARA